MCSSIQDLSDDLLRRILTTVYQNQIVTVVYAGKGQLLAACSLPPCLGVSKRFARLARPIPIRLLRVQSHTDASKGPVKLLRSIRCPVQIADFSDDPSRGPIDRSCILRFVSRCRYPEQVQTIRIIHDGHYKCYENVSSVSHCSRLEGISSIVSKRMPQCKLLISSHRE